MNTILIIENEVVELASLIGIFKKWREDIEILTAHTVQAAIDILSGQQVDLVVCDLSLSKNNSFNDLHRLTYAYPYVPCLAIVQKGAVDSKQQGISYCLDRPFSPDQLLQHTEELLKIATSGTMENVATHNLLQMLESEEKTCTLRVLSKKDSGLLYMQNGS
ncbi:MAG: response regulator, partial [Desulfocapsa sp.]|nr:response regulator [Desulfocapsa sp.]